MAIYEKSVRLLMKDMANDFAMKKGDRITKKQTIAWFNDKYPKIKLGTITAHLVRMSTNARSRFHYSAKPVEDDLFYQIDGSTYSESTAGLLPHVFPNKVWEYDAKEKGYKIRGHATLYSSCEHNSKLKLEPLF